MTPSPTPAPLPTEAARPLVVSWSFFLETSVCIFNYSGAGIPHTPSCTWHCSLNRHLGAHCVSVCTVDLRLFNICVAVPHSAFGEQLGCFQQILLPIRLSIKACAFMSTGTRSTRGSFGGIRTPCAFLSAGRSSICAFLVSCSVDIFLHPILCSWTWWFVTVRSENTISL